MHSFIHKLTLPVGIGDLILCNLYLNQQITHLINTTSSSVHYHII